MGASGWHYFVKYQPDANTVLQDLRNDIFKRRAYPTRTQEEENLAAIRKLSATSADPDKAVRQLKALLNLARQLDTLEQPDGAARKRPRRQPKTIDELLEQRGEEGTGTILDIGYISGQPEFGALCPLSSQQLHPLFGTDHPTREMVDRWRGRIQSVEDPPLYRRGQGVFFTVYANEKPDAIYIEGCSGD